MNCDWEFSTLNRQRLISCSQEVTHLIIGNCKSYDGKYVPHDLALATYKNKKQFYCTRYIKIQTDNENNSMITYLVVEHNNSYVNRRGNGVKRWVNWFVMFENLTTHKLPLKSRSQLSGFSCAMDSMGYINKRSHAHKNCSYLQFYYTPCPKEKKKNEDIQSLQDVGITKGEAMQLHREGVKIEDLNYLTLEDMNEFSLRMKMKLGDRIKFRNAILEFQTKIRQSNSILTSQVENELFLNYEIENFDPDIFLSNGKNNDDCVGQLTNEFINPEEHTDHLLEMIHSLRQDLENMKNVNSSILIGEN